MTIVYRFLLFLSLFVSASARADVDQFVQKLTSEYQSAGFCEAFPILFEYTDIYGDVGFFEHMGTSLADAKLAQKKQCSPAQLSQRQSFFRRLESETMPKLLQQQILNYGKTTHSNTQCYLLAKFASFNKYELKMPKRIFYPRFENFINRLDHIQCNLENNAKLATTELEAQITESGWDYNQVIQLQ